MAWWSEKTHGIQAWQALCGEAFVDLKCTTDTPDFRGNLRQVGTETGSLSWVATDSLQVRRTARSTRGYRGDHLLMTLQAASHSTVEQSGRVARLTPGTAALYDPQGPYTLDFPTGAQHLVVLSISRHDLSFSDSDIENLIARTIPADTTGLASLTGLVQGIAQDSAEAALHSNSILADLLTMIGDYVLENIPHRRNDNDLLAEIKRWMRKNLADGTLSAARIAAYFFISERSLYTLFARAGQSPARWLREQRAARARTLLSSTSRSIAAIGTSCGYPDPGTFSRFFKSATGVTPSEYRGSR